MMTRNIQNVIAKPQRDCGNLNRFVSLLLACILLVGMLPMTVLTASAAERDVSGTVRTSELSDGDSLVLKNNTELIIDVDRKLDSIKAFKGEPYNLIISGTKTLSVNPENDTTYGITVEDLEVNSGNLYVYSNLNAIDAVSVTLNDGTVDATSESLYAISSGEVTINGGEMSAVSTESIGMRGGTMIITGGYVYASGEEEGIKQGSIRMSNAEVTASSITARYKMDISDSKIICEKRIATHFDDINITYSNIKTGSIITGYESFHDDDIMLSNCVINCDRISSHQNLEINNCTANCKYIYADNFHLIDSTVNVSASLMQIVAIKAKLNIEIDNSSVIIQGADTGILSEEGAIGILDGSYVEVHSAEAAISVGNRGRKIILGENIYIIEPKNGELKQKGIYDSKGQAKDVILSKKDFVNISFNANGGTGAMDTETIELHDTFTLPECTLTPPAGAHFHSWYIASNTGLNNGQTIFQPGMTIYPTGDVTVTARWENDYNPTWSKLTYSAGDGSGDSFDDYAETGVGYIFPACPASYTAPENMKFDHWNYRSADGSVSGYAAPGDSVTFTSVKNYTVTASYIYLRSYTVRFEMQGHGKTLADAYVYEGSCLSEPAIPKAEGYGFGGWYTDSAYTERYDFDTPVTASFTLYAKWIERIPCTVTLDPGTSADTVNYVYCYVGDWYTLPTRTEAGFVYGSRLDYWLAEDGTKYYPYDSVLLREPMTFTAIWKAPSDIILTEDSFPQVGHTLTVDIFAMAEDNDELMTAVSEGRVKYYWYGYKAGFSEKLEDVGLESIYLDSRYAKAQVRLIVEYDMVQLYAYYDIEPSKTQYDVNLIYNDGGAAAVSQTTARHLDYLNVTATPDFGYELESITYTPEGGETVNITGYPYFSMPESNVDVEVTFRPLPDGTYAIRTLFDENMGYVSTSNDRAESGETVWIYVYPGEDYRFNGFKVISGDITPDEIEINKMESAAGPGGPGYYECSFTVKNANVELQAEFIPASVSEIFALVHGSDIRYADGDTIDIPEGGDAYICFSFETYEEGYVAGWNPDTLTERGFTVDPDPVFFDGEEVAYVHVSAGDLAAGSDGELSYGFYRFEDIFGEDAPGWENAAPVFGGTVNIRITEKPVQYMLGDADGDGHVTITDATYIQRHLSNLGVKGKFVEEAADVDGDGKVTITDATLIQRHLASMKTKYPIGEYI